jgi:hypothetical protein
VAARQATQKDAVRCSLLLEPLEPLAPVLELVLVLVRLPVLEQVPLPLELLLGARPVQFLA